MIERNRMSAASPSAETVVAVNPAEFAGIDRACSEFLRVIDQVAALAAEIGDQSHWGLGERDARLISGPALVARLRSTASADEHSIGAAMDAHRRIIADLRRAHRIVHDRMVLADHEWAVRLRELEPTARQPERLCS